MTLDCRATLHGDTLVIDRNQAETNIDGDTQSGPPKGACEALSWTGSRALTF